MANDKEQRLCGAPWRMEQ